jgi:hypothetical protein
MMPEELIDLYFREVRGVCLDKNSSTSYRAENGLRIFQGRQGLVGQGLVRDLIVP